MSRVQVFDESHAVKCQLAADVLRSSGNLRLQVTGWSMLPSVWPGDTLFIEPVSAHAVSQGDIVLFQRDRRLFAHRVVAQSGQCELITRGDAMPTTDAPVSEAELLGRVSRIERDGRSLQPHGQVRRQARVFGALIHRSRIAARVVFRMRDLRRAYRSSN